MPNEVIHFEKARASALNTRKRNEHTEANKISRTKPISKETKIVLEKTPAKDPKSKKDNELIKLEYKVNPNKKTTKETKRNKINNLSLVTTGRNDKNLSTREITSKRSPKIKKTEKEKIKKLK